MTVGDTVFRRIPGEGWLVLVGSTPELGGETADLMERLLQRLDLSRPIAAIAAPDSDPEAINEFLESLEEWLGTEAGLLELQGDLDVEGWDESGLLVLEGHDGEIWVEALQGEAGEKLRRSFDRGAVILAIGGAASAFGAQVVSAVRPDTLSAGLAWIPEAIVVVDPEEAYADVVRAWLRQSPRRLVLRLEPASILALGPEQQVERWSQASPEIVLGPGWESA